MAFARRLVQTPSPSGDEGEVAKVVSREMERLGYDRVFLDEAGNVVGLLRGRCAGGSVMFNTHLDHVDPGRPELWEYDPYGGEIAHGYIHGRGASDVKGAIASQVYGVALVKALGLPILGNVLVTAVVQEEMAEGIGIKYLCDVTLPKRRLSFDLVVVGEATNLNIALGHRGRYELEVVTYGRSCHASAPWRGVNAVYKMLPVIQGVEKLNEDLGTHPFLGKSTLTPAESSLIRLSLDALRALGQDPKLIRWDFATDGFYPAAVLGIPTIGYAPGEERYAHTPEDRVSIDHLVSAAAGNAAIALAVAG